MKTSIVLTAFCLLAGCSSAAPQHPITASESELICTAPREEPSASMMDDGAPPFLPLAVSLAPSIDTLERWTADGTPSAPPKSREWRDAQVVNVARDAVGCTSHRTREWLRIRCPVLGVATVSMLAGNRKGTSVRLIGASDQSSKPAAEVQFPLRPGDRRVFQITAFSGGDEWDVGESVVATISESWVDPDRGPIVVVGP
jgi:hypothetical protein